LSREFHRFVNLGFCADKTWLWGVLVCAVFVVFYPGCTSNPPLSQKAVTFRQQTLEDFERLTPKLGLAFDSPDMALDEVIIDFLQELHDNGRHVLSLGVLDPSGNYRAGYRLDDTAPGSIEKSGYKDMSFASFKGVDRIVSSRKIVQMPLYFQEQSVLVVGAPLVREDRLLGIMCLSFDTEKFEEEWGISKQEFLRIDFNVR
jgi:uncharacterized protein GlcG (DUF336 family)